MKKSIILFLIITSMTTLTSAQTNTTAGEKQFLLLFRNNSGEGKYLVTPEDMQKAMPKWQSWIGGIAAQGKLVATNPIEYEGKIVGNQNVLDKPYLVKKELVVGYLILKTSSMEDAIAISKTCPIITEYNGNVEVRAMISFPQQ